MRKNSEQTKEDTALSFLGGRAEVLLKEARTLSDVLNIRAAAKSAQHYFQAALHAHDAAKYAAEIRLRAERRAGQMIVGMQMNGELVRREDNLRVGNSPKSHNVTSGKTLADYGVEPMQSSRWQQIAAVPEEVFEAYIAEGKEKESHELTTSGLRTSAKFARRDEQAEEIKAEPAALPEGPFRVIVADPPWPYALRRPTVNDARGYPDYAGMALADIEALPIQDLAADDAVLWLWTTNAFLKEGFNVLEAWGFKYRTTLTWVKNRIGLGDWLRGQTEHCLFASRGKPVITLKAQSTALVADVLDHSRKPDQFYALVESLCPTPPSGKIDIFARQPREGWRVWGHEVNAANV
jgi:N6-adenosine-specific RNA methylase IME4